MSRLTRVALTTALAVCALAASPLDARAQRRRAVVVPRHVVVSSFYSYPFGFYDPWFGFSAYPWGPFPPYPYYAADPGASVKFDVTPKETEVYVDGYYAGIVDDFDGAFQRLRTFPGEHEIELYLNGYRTFKQKVYLAHDHTFKMKYAMERLGAGEHAEPRPQPPAAPPDVQPGAPGGPPQNYPAPPPRSPYGRRPPPPRTAGQTPENPRGPYGTLAIRVQPGDADVLIDGERWRGPSGDDRLTIDVSEGRHTVQVQKAGYQSYVTDVQVRRGETTPLNVSLRAQ